MIHKKTKHCFLTKNRSIITQIFYKKFARNIVIITQYCLCFILRLLQFCMSESSEKIKAIKGILGDKYVGKTYLCHKLTGRIYEGYEETASIAQFKSPESQKASKFVYVDNPPLDNISIINIGSVHQYDVLVFLFKDCDTFTKLFEFFETIKQTLDSQQSHHVRQYWSQPKKIIVVYSNFQSVIDVQVKQLFTLLIDEIRQFCEKVIFETFIWKRQQDNWRDLKFLIQRQPIPLYINKKVSDIPKQAKMPNLVKQISYKQGPLSEQKVNAKHQYPIQIETKAYRESGFQKQDFQNKAYRKTIIIQKIRQSFILDQNRLSSFSNSQTNYKNQNLLESFRQSQGKYDSKIDQQLNKYNEEKVEKLHKYVQISEEQTIKKVSEQRKKQSIKNNAANLQIVLQISKTNEIPNKPQTGFSQRNNRQKKVKDRDATCNLCQLI